MNEREIFQGAIDHSDTAQRRAYLDEACDGDSALRARIEALLASHAAASQFLNVPALVQFQAPAAAPRPTIDFARADEENANERTGSSAGDDPENDPNTAPDISFLQPSSKPGSIGTLGSYEILQVIGQGAFGIVFKAFDEKLQRTVAIKAMNPRLAATSPPRKRFLREARSVAAIKHENIVQIYTVEEEPLPYLVMEYIDGQTLQQKLNTTGPLDVAEILHLGRQMALGLAAAHARGLIHRDIKPGNILLEQGAEPKVKITDFGLARAADDASMTRTGVIAGTPLFMAPEQAQGLPLDHRADLFSLGSVLYQMASGRPPFRAATAIAVLKRVTEETPRPIREIIPEVPDWLCAIISKLHTKNVEERFQSAKEVADLLGRCLSELQQNGRVESLGKVVPNVAKSANVEIEPLRSGPSTNKKTPASVHARFNRRWVAAAAMIGILFAGLGMTEATGVTNLRGTVIRLFSPDGVLVVEVDDPNVSVTIDGEEMLITGAGAKEIRLKPGQYKVLASKGGKLVRQELVTVTKNGRQVVRVSKEPEATAIVGNGPNGKTDAAPLPTIDPDRRAAEYALSIGGQIGIGFEGGPNSIGVTRLPKQPFLLTRVSLPDNKKVTDAGLVAFEGCKSLVYLSLVNTAVTDVGMVHFRDCKNLEYLNLINTEIGDNGLAHFAGCKNIRNLLLMNTQVGDRGLAGFKGCTKLQSLDLGAPAVSDLGLENFNNCIDLEFLNLNCPRMTDAAMANFQHCKKLQSVALHGGVTDAGLEHIRNCNELKGLVVQHTRVTGAILGWLDAWPKLQGIRFTNQPVTDAHLALLKDGNPLTWLDIGDPAMTDVGMKHLAKCQNLTNLNLTAPAITDTGLTPLHGLKNLRKLKLGGKNFTADNVKKLAEALPDCEITWNGQVMKSKQ